MFRTLGLVALLAASAHADCYMHNPRGSNGRLNEANTNRNNGNRLFDTQNNAKGGYCVGPAMNYYEGSMVSIEWTNQHGCGQNPKLYCNMVVQYMCGSKEESDGLIAVRDGTDTDTIPNTPAGANQKDGNGEFQFGMHEPLKYYEDCNARDRNYGLWASDRNIVNAGRQATDTRQNNNGNRRGLECPEERDYYPYWHPTPWRDVAVLTQDMAWCSFYQMESENVKPRGHCLESDGAAAPANNEAACVSPQEWKVEWAFGHPLADSPGSSASPGRAGLPAPDCVLARWSRHNHLGNGLLGFANSYNWTLPTADEEPCIADNDCACVMRLRYNISTTDLDKGTGPSEDASTPGGKNTGNQPEVLLDWTKNQDNSPVKEDPDATFDDVTVKLAIDTTQFGRTFQDRTHVFGIMKRPDGVAQTTRIHNLNVRGKRGNIVQTYPSTEYDFVPQNLYVRTGDLVHFQWTGCDTNPAGNAGEGTDQTDRSNIVQMQGGCQGIGSQGKDQGQGMSTPHTDDWIAANPECVMFPDKELRQFMAYGDQDPASCEDYATLLARNGGNENQADADPENCFKLNKMSQHFDAGLIRMNNTGNFYYMSSRNNNFSNRGHKGSMTVANILPIWAIVLLVVGGVLAVGSAGVAGSMFYAKGHPHSGVASLMNRMS